MGNEKENPPESSGQSTPYSRLLKLAGLSSIAVACLYALGFLVHLGHVYMLGFRPWPLRSLDDRLLAGQFIFQSVHSVTRTLIAPQGLSWIGNRDLTGYLCGVIILICIDLLLRFHNIKKWFGARAWRRKLSTTLHVMKGMVLVGLIGSWIALLTSPFIFHDLLFPLSHLNDRASLERFVNQASSFDALSGISSPERQANRKALLRSALSEEFSAAARQGDASLQERLSSFVSWRRRGVAERESAFGFLLVISTILIVLLANTDRRLAQMTTARVKWFSSAVKLGHRAWRTFMIVFIAFQAVTLPFDFGILMIERPVPRVEVRITGIEGLAHEELLLLGEDEDMTYFYSPFAFWTLYAIPNTSIQEMRISGKTSALSWLDIIFSED